MQIPPPSSHSKILPTLPMLNSRPRTIGVRRIKITNELGIDCTISPIATHGIGKHPIGTISSLQTRHFGLSEMQGFENGVEFRLMGHTIRYDDFEDPSSMEFNQDSTWLAEYTIKGNTRPYIMLTGLRSFSEDLSIGNIDHVSVTNSSSFDIQVRASPVAGPGGPDYILGNIASRSTRSFRLTMEQGFKTGDRFQIYGITDLGRHIETDLDGTPWEFCEDVGTQAEYKVEGTAIKPVVKFIRAAQAGGVGGLGGLSVRA
ncbi:hypothetical protein DL96DRAFT_1721783 [Flagelloscypha sp. PMI_526]|nr:hypothetical protein DL96DRAFT_1721783 [Flagelloscypha sp. PMI_526]